MFFITINGAGGLVIPEGIILPVSCGAVALIVLGQLSDIFGP
jgi:hypothetical protein